MIVFDLACAGGHVFEAWFGSSADYEDQRGRGLVECPLCGARDVAKAPMTPNVAAKGNAVASLPPQPVQGGVPAPAEIKAMLAALARAQAAVLASSEHVGARFADEARAIHLGDAPERAIHGVATREQAESLAEEGIAVAPLPLPIMPGETAH